ncbi:MAG: sulfotransferase family protein [Pseudomonadota bacterium]
MSKVFCLGFQKTGTSSLGLAFEVLGYGKIAGYYEFRDLAQRQDLTWDDVTERALQVAEQHRGFQDMPWPLFYETFAERYPDAKFILVIRNTDDWIRSCVNDFGHYPNPIRQLIYDAPYPKGHEDIFRARYERHNRDVQEYFKDQPDRLLVLKTGEFAWGPLCTFLGHPVPEQPWPHANKRAEKDRQKLWWKVKRNLRKVFG